MTYNGPAPRSVTPSADTRREQAEADLCMEPLPDLARSVLDFFRSRPTGHATYSVFDVEAGFNLSHPEQPPVPVVELWQHGMLPLVERGWLTHLAGDGWQLTEAGCRSKP